MFLVIDASTYVLLGVFPDGLKAQQCADNTPAHCIILKTSAARVSGSWIRDVGDE